MESYRTERGPRQRVVSYLGEMDHAGRVGIRAAAAGAHQYDLFDNAEPEWVEVDIKGVSVERKQALGGAWLGLELCRCLGLPEFLDCVMDHGREGIPSPVMTMILAIGRLCDPSSELHFAEHSFAVSALEELLGVQAAKINDDRLYRALDKLLPHKAALEKHLKEKLGDLFSLDYDLLLYDVTSTYLEGQAEDNDLAQRGYSRDHRPDCKQVNIALVVSRCGMPLGCQLFAGNKTDVKTVEDIVNHVEDLYGQANRIWVMDRGMASASNVEFLRKQQGRYIIGTPKSMLKRFERELGATDWKQVRQGLEVQMCPSGDGDEVFILCRSAQRIEKERAMHDRFETRIEAGLKKIAEAAKKRKQKAGDVERRVGRLLGHNTRAAGLFEARIEQRPDGYVDFTWLKRDQWRDWARLSEGCYLLRSNVTDWSPGDLRPVWHQKRERVEAHFLVCFLAFVLWKTLAQFCAKAGLGDEPRNVFNQIAEIAIVDVVLPTRSGVSIRKRCIAKPTPHQNILLQHLGLRLPSSLPAHALE